MKALIVGSGSWGLAVGKVLCDNGHQVTVYARNPNTVREINYNHTNNKYFDNVILPREMVAVNELKDIDSYDFVVMATPSNVSVEVGKQIAELIDKKIIIVNLAKGFNPENHGLLSEEFKKVFGDKLECYAALLGPSHAEEVILGMQTTVNIVCEDEEYGKKLQKAFANDYFRVYLNTDMIGCQYGSSLKNIIAIASGILYGLGLGDNAKASLMTRGLAEMTRYGVHFGGRKETFMGLCGMGDLIVTCTSRHSRNWQAGYSIGINDSAEEFWRTNTKTVEGVNACKIIKGEADAHGIEMPITTEVYNVLFAGKKPSIAIRDLMMRDLKKEGN
ncbi:MAG: NAD(P)-dependent glycerol-3-phosphate dehydrogenase [Erysipelotrichaceae bacterium]|nr:NAD(P)-dependent glycerol-3-phosphate dehydrogenase [Erysipelotrichaceae bacterium]